MDLSKAERLAALLDGKCSEREREALLAELAAGGEDLEVFADAAALLHDEAEVEVAADVIPLRPPVQKPEKRRTWKPPRPWVGLALAAGIAALIAIPLLSRDGGAHTPGEIVAELSAPRGGFPSTVERAPWGGARGGSSGALSPGAKVQLGATLAELELRAASSDTAGIGVVASDIARLLSGVTAARELAAYYDGVARHGVSPGGLDSDVGRRAMLQGGDHAVLGAWLETARVAVDRKDAAFFGSRLSRRVLKGSLRPDDLPQYDADALRNAVKATPPRWAELAAELEKVLRRLAQG